MSHIVFFDGVCNLCNNSVDFILKRDPKGKFKFTSLQSDFAKATLPQKGSNLEDMRTIILLKNDRLFYRSSAMLEIVRELGFPWPMLYIFKLVPGFIRDAVYNLISHNRYRWFGKRDSCRIPSPQERSRFLEDTAAHIRL